MSIIETIKNVVFVPIHPKGKSIILVAVIAAITLSFIEDDLWFVGALLVAFCVYFFRNPVRTVPHAEGMIVATGDGVISNISESTLPEELNAKDDTVYHKISIFLNVFNVHVNRLPASGTVTREVYVPGKFMNAALDKASKDNERSVATIRTKSNEVIGFAQIAGLVARRIITQIHEGDTAVQGARYGIIRFGSRCDVYIPKHYKLLVSVGSTTLGGETMLAIDPKTFDANSIIWVQD
jgi:phosphatidylserine decarboxylase